MRLLAGWRLPLRLARRDAWRHRRTSVLVLVLIILPVMAVTAASVVWATTEIDGDEALDRRIGAAQASVMAEDGAVQVIQHFDPHEYSGWTGPADTTGPTATLEDVLGILGHGRPTLEVARSSMTFETDRGLADAEVTRTDPTDPLAAGLFRLEEGRWPAGPGEVVVNGDLVDRGPGVGETLVVTGVDGADFRDDPRELEVVGIAESTSYHGSPIAVVPPGGLGPRDPDSGHSRQWLVGGDPVTWADVQRLNDIGATALSRAVLADPPPESELDPAVRDSLGGPDDAMIAVAVLIAVMVLLEVVLLAGPAFAVGARRQSRHLALLAASGGTPRQTRRVVLASAVVLGGAGAVLGVLLGLVAGWAAVPVVARFDTAYPGPYDVPWLLVGGVAAGGLLSAVLAAFVPAWIASRQDVVAVLAGRRGDRRPSVRSPLIGLVVLGSGVGLAAFGAVSGGEVLIAASAILAVVGMIFLVPVVVVAVARLARRLPLALRFAARDAARHRTRTVPAVAAVAATVAGVVALGIATTSDEAQSEATYRPSLPIGMASVSLAWDVETDWQRLRALVERRVPDASVSAVSGVPDGATTWREFTFRVGGDEVPRNGWAGSLGASVLVADELPPSLPAIPEDQAPRAAAALADGGAVVFSSEPVAASTVRVRVRAHDEEGVVAGTSRADLPAAVVHVVDDFTLPQAVLSRAAAERLGVPVRQVSLLVDGVSESAEQDIQEELNELAADGIGFYVERGYEADGETVVVQLILAGLGAVLMLGGTITATSLALSDARPDLATLSAVGASARTRRAVAASYALVVGLVGALLGAAVGFVPGIAITYPLTGTSGYSGMGEAPSHYLDVPWLLILGVVVVLPLVTAAVVGLTARSRLPLVSRLE